MVAIPPRPGGCLLLLCALSALPVGNADGDEPLALRGAIIDQESSLPLAARLYIQNERGEFFHAESAADEGSAVPYSKQRSPASIEVHTTLSAHDFVAKLPAGTYRLTAERGKEYRPATATIELTPNSPPVRLRLSRWIAMSSLGWYSGETHVHRSVDELPTAMLADDLNVTLPLTHWVTRAYTPPSQGDKNSAAVTSELIMVDDTHVIYPLNTEYEIFTVNGQRHTLGAIFALNHKTVLESGVPPVRPIAAQVHREGGLLELDKHNWPWSMMLVPVAQVDLYELTNNHVWRTEFYYKDFGEPPAPSMHVEQDAQGVTEQGWLDFTFQNYYALLDCGFRLRPTAGTASGVHPVPLGFGRVYVHLPDGFSYDAWMAGLDAGRSFVTTGPMLVVAANDRPLGTTFRFTDSDAAHIQFEGTATSEYPLSRIEIVSSNGVIEPIDIQNQRTASGAYTTSIVATRQPRRSTWFAVRCFERLPNGRVRFAHTAPLHIDIADQPLVPRAADAQYLVDRVQREIQRNQELLPEGALEEFREALQSYRAAAAAAH